MGYKYYSVLIATVLLFAVGCKPEATEQPSDLSIKVDFTYGNQPLVYGQEYVYDTDKKIKFELVKFYVSKPELKNSEGNWVPFSTEYFLVDLAHPTMQAGKIKKGTYSALQFGVGVDNSRNIQSDPNAIPATDYPTDHPLNFAADMYWGWSSGYIFSKIEGRIDVDNNGSYSDMEDKAFSYHPGVPELYRSVMLEKSFVVDADVSQQTILLDMVKLIDAVKLIQHPTAHPNGTSSPEYNYALPLVNNFRSAFE